MTAQEQKTEFFSSINLSLPFQKTKREKDGILRCAKYAFSPNELGYCGPDKNQDLFEYCQTKTIDAGLSDILKDFQTLYPYLNLIAKTNQIKDPFNQLVVNAYWLGNDLLNNVSLNQFYRHLSDGLNLNKKLNKKLLNKVFGKFQKGALPHHNYHVFNIYKRTGHLDINHTLTTMDKCRISWAKITAVGSEVYQVKYQPLVYQNLTDQPQLGLGHSINKTVVKGFVTSAMPGDWISLHWEWPCEILTDKQLCNLRIFTKRFLADS